MNWMDYADYLNEEEAAGFLLDDLWQTSGGQRGLKMSDEWKQTILLKAASQKEKPKTKKKGGETCGS